MNQQADIYSPLVAMAKNLGSLAIDRSGELLARQIDHTDDVINRCGKQMHAVLPKVSPEPEKWGSPAAMEELIGGTNTLLRELVMAGVDYQMEMLRLIQAQTSDVQKAISDALHEQMAKVDAGLGGKKRTGKGNAEMQRMAA